MPSFIALILTIIFVVWLLTLEHKGSPHHSWALWLPVILTLLLGTKSLAGWFNYSSSSGLLESPMDRNFIILLTIAGILILIKRGFNLFQAVQENKLLIFIAGYMLVSIFWSDILMTSFKRWTREILAPLVMSFILLSENNPREAMLSLLRRTIYICIPFSLCLIKYFPDYGVQYGQYFGELMWVGVTTQKNGLGRLCLIAIYFLFWSLIKRRQERNIPAVKYQTAAEIFLFVLSCYLLKGPSIGAMSATSVTVLAIALTIFILLLIGNKYKIYPHANILTAVMAVGIIWGVVTLFTSGQAVGSFTAMLGRDGTLTGRTEIWTQYLPMAMRHPLLGHGFGGFWTVETIELQGVNEAHNGYLGILLTLGFVGLIFMALFLLSSCRKAQQMMRADFYWASLWICFLFMAVIHNISESSLESFSKNMTLMIVFMSVCSSSYNRYLLRDVCHEQIET